MCSLYCIYGYFSFDSYVFRFDSEMFGLDVSNVLGLGCEFGMRIALWLQFFMELYSSIASTALVKATRKKDGETNLIDGQFLRKLCFVEEQISTRQS